MLTVWGELMANGALIRPNKTIWLALLLLGGIL